VFTWKEIVEENVRIFTAGTKKILIDRHGNISNFAVMVESLLQTDDAEVGREIMNSELPFEWANKYNLVVACNSRYGAASQLRKLVLFGVVIKD
jgi:hypothetical protein